MTPWLVTPGPWSDKDLEHHTRQLAEGVGGRRCAALPRLRDLAHHKQVPVLFPSIPTTILPPFCPSLPVLPQTGLASNCSCNCLAPKVILLAADWPQADAFVAGFKAELAKRAAPAPYYPGLRQRYDAFKQQYPQVRRGLAEVWVMAGWGGGHHCATRPQAPGCAAAPEPGWTTRQPRCARPPASPRRPSPSRRRQQTRARRAASRCPT